MVSATSVVWLASGKIETVQGIGDQHVPVFIVGTDLDYFRNERSEEKSCVALGTFDRVVVHCEMLGMMYHLEDRPSRFKYNKCEENNSPMKSSQRLA
jgi:hypothetical protein